MAQQNILKGHLKASGLIKRVTEQWDLTTQCSFEELWWCVQSVIVRERENESDRQTSRQTGRQAGRRRTKCECISVPGYTIWLALYCHLWVHSVYFPIAGRQGTGDNTWMCDDARGSYSHLENRGRSSFQHARPHPRLQGCISLAKTHTHTYWKQFEKRFF